MRFDEVTWGMYSFNELRKAGKISVDGAEMKVAIIGNVATQFLAVAVNGLAKINGINIIVQDTDYNQIDAQLLDDNSEVFQFNPQFIVLWLATDKLYEEFLDSSLGDRERFAESVMDRVKRYWQLIESKSESKIIQPNFTEIDDKVLGQYSAKIATSFCFQVRKLNCLLAEAMRDDKRVYPVDLLAVQLQLGMGAFYDPALYYNAKMTVAINAMPYVAKAVVDVLVAMTGRIKKCIVLDLDNTLWGGVIGDDGIGGIEIGELGRGHAFADFQRWLKQLKECGIILTVCSKNDENIAKQPFEKHEEMILKLSDISLFIANWNDKASNIRLIQETLNISMDSIVFVDDNSFERNLVRQMIPEITVPEMPEDPAEYLSFLQSQNYFENISFVPDFSDRTSQYQAEYERKKIECSFDSIDEYLISLDMVGEVKKFEPIRYARIAQLTQRSNQFNLRTIRYTEDEIEKIANDKTYIPLYYTLRDKYGDYGLVSVVILKKIGSDTAFVDTWLMSCRVLKRGMEEFVVNNLVAVAEQAGIKVIEAEYIPTAKNKMVENIYNNMGFSEITDNNYSLRVSDYIEKKVYISKEND